MPYDDLKNFNGPFKDALISFISFKRACGYKYDGKTVRFYKYLDNFFHQAGVTNVEMPPNILNRWLEKKPNEKPMTYKQRYQLTKVFVDYLNQNGYSSIFFPEIDISSIKSDFVPYIFSHEEIEKLFIQFDYYVEHICSPLSLTYGLPIYFRLLYSTGMRRQEALNLTWNDINFKKGLITITNSKNHVSRVIPISQSMKENLMGFFNSICGEREHLFIKDEGSKRGGYLEEWWPRALKDAKIERRIDCNGPRIHDLRHTFAVHTLQKMSENGIDIYTSLPLLSKYLGHKCVTETEYYLRLTKDNFEEICTATNNYCPSLFPEIGEEYD